MLTTVMAALLPVTVYAWLKYGRGEIHSGKVGKLRRTWVPVILMGLGLWIYNMLQKGWPSFFIGMSFDCLFDLKWKDFDIQMKLGIFHAMKFAMWILDVLPLAKAVFV